MTSDSSVKKMEKNLGKILCIDDEEDILDSLERTLRGRFEVLTATSPEDAKSIISKNPDISVIICDHILGIENGTQFLLHARALIPHASRVLLSGQVDLKSLEEAINSSVIHKFILKPWENDQLILHVLEAYKIHNELIEKERLQNLSITDALTQLTNHRFFHESIRLEWDKAIRKDSNLSLVMIDVDKFKRFNDRFGHPEGDNFLIHIASTLKENAPFNTSLSRYGGEEFALILPNTNSQEALTIAETLRKAVLNTNYKNYPLSISLGVATAPEHASSVDELIISADQSLLQAKRRGRNQTVVGLSFDH